MVYGRVENEAPTHGTLGLLAFFGSSGGKIIGQAQGIGAGILLEDGSGPLEVMRYSDANQLAPAPVL
jgi:hypothetical protein